LWKHFPISIRPFFATIRVALLQAIDENGGLTTDMWSDIKQRRFITLTAHFTLDKMMHAQILTLYMFYEQQNWN